MHVSVLSDVVKGGITSDAILEGLAVVLSNSGVASNPDLPTIVLAGANDSPVYILEAAPDNFPRPVDSRQYTATWYTTLGSEDGDFSEPLETVTLYRVGMSNLDNPTVPSGVRALVHRGGRYTVPAACFTDSADIRNPDAYIVVGANGKWEYSASKTNAVGQVVEYDASTGSLVFELWQ